MEKRCLRLWLLFGLFALGLLSVLIHTMPLLKYHIWGSDSGEYYTIAERFIETKGNRDFTYNGWGVAYKEFPGMYYVIDEYHLISGVSLFECLRLVIPSIMFIAALLVYIIGKEITSRREIGILGAFILVLSFPHTYATSHTMAGSLAEIPMLLFLTILFVFYGRGNHRLPGLYLPYILPYIVTFVLSATAVVITHHLTTFILATILLALPFFRIIIKIHNTGRKPMIESVLFIFVSWLAFTYWLFFTEKFRDKILLSDIGIPRYMVVILAYLTPLLLAYIIVFTDKYTPVIGLQKKTLKARAVRFTILITVLLMFAYVTAVYGFPGTYINIPPYAVMYLIPLCVVVAFVPQGPSYIDLEAEGPSLLSMTLGILCLFGISYILFPTIVIPYRLGQYIMIPVAVLAATGIIYFNREIYMEQGGLVFITIAITTTLALGTLAPTVYPPKEIMGGFEEGIPWNEFLGVYWIKHNTPKNSGIASDHRMSSMIYGFAHRNATWDYADKIFHSSIEAEYYRQINSCKYPMGNARVDYVYLSDTIKEGVALLQWEPARDMRPEAIEKFNKYPFIKVYDDGYNSVYSVTFDYS